MRVPGSRRLMGDCVNDNAAKILGWLTATLMAAAAFSLLAYRTNQHLNGPARPRRGGARPAAGRVSA
jgi:hypothetical protein